MGEKEYMPLLWSLVMTIGNYGKGVDGDAHIHTIHRQHLSN
jgi:hypothetical protein